MNKAKLQAIKKILEAEKEGLLPFQSRARIYKQLESDGLIASARVESGLLGFYGYILTDKGRTEYKTARNIHD